MLTDVCDAVHDLVDLADRTFAKLFTEPWPPQAPPRYQCGFHSIGKVLRRKEYSYDVQNLVQKSSGRSLSSPRRAYNSQSYSRLYSHAQRRSPKFQTRVTSNHLHKDACPAPSDPKSKLTISGRTRAYTVVEIVSGASKRAKQANEEVKHMEVGTPVSSRRTVNVSKPHVRTIGVDKIQPDLWKCDVLVVAVAEMEICKEIFAAWRVQLDLMDSRRNDELESAIISSVFKLDTSASAALRASHSILRNYRSVARVMEHRLIDISKSKDGGPIFVSKEIRYLGSSILSQSRALERHVKDMQGQLRELVQTIERTKESADRRAFRRKIWKWLSKVFKVLSALLSVGGAIFGLLYPLGLIGSAGIAGASMLSGAAARLCDIAQKRYNDTAFNELIVFLRDHIPESAEAAQLALTSFQACHRVLQLELEVREGKRSGWLSPHEAGRTRWKWTEASERLHETHVSFKQ